MRLAVVFSILLFPSIGLAQARPEVIADENVMVVLDASGSMWGQVAGRTKIETVRGAYATLAKGWEDQGTQSGLIAYGHRRKGDCTDIEVLSKPGQTNSSELSKMVSKLNPKGKTPLGAAVRMAAEELKYTEKKATVILLSDGIETCGVDPCQLGSELEELGIDFTTHVIGFDIRSEDDKVQLQCLAENTGGRFTSADNAHELREAMNKTITSPTNLSFQGLLGETGETVSSASWVLESAVGTIRVSTDGASLTAGEISEKPLPDGAYTITATSNDYSGSTRFEIPHKQDVIYVRLYPNLPKTTLTPDTKIFAGDDFDVLWSGAGDVDDQISIVPVGGSWDQAYDTALINTGNPVTLKAPSVTGSYELIYLNNAVEMNRIDARILVEVFETEYLLRPNREIQSGQSFQVEWRGPGLEGDMIAIGPQTRGTDDYTSIDWITGSTLVNLTAPNNPGTYELRYYGDGYELQFTQIVSVK